MRNMRFVSKEEAIEWKDHEYAPGENAIAEMCNLFCSTAGRGHAHYLKCAYDSVDQCVYSGARDHRRHCDSALLVPRPTVEVDEVLHAEYWETIGWEDPCGSARERATFAKCPYMCQSVEHKGDRKVPSSCDLPAWHAPVDTESYVVRNGYSYINGHRFACYHPSTDISHHIFVLDCSGSMKGRPWTALMNGVRRYMSGQVQRGSNQDIVSIVTFGDDGHVVFEGVRIGNAATRCVNFRGGGTFYAEGLKAASAIISRTNTNMYRPVMVFFTDGRPADAKQGLKLAKDIRQRYSISGLRAFVVGFGKASEFGLKVLSDQLGGSVHAAGSLEGLVDAFRSISASVGARTGLICSKNTTT
ncbi:unnamed protein product [Hyaloperonospora brassicae]|nr:unnamed protein product [Hyaloperonospora brassicae]